MKLSAFLFLSIILASCDLNTTEPESESAVDLNIFTKAREALHAPEFQAILDSAHVSGSILIYSVKDKTYFSNDFIWADKAFLPASTFKITNSIIALETGVVKSDTSILKWNGEPRGMNVWEQDLTLKEAFHYSCVPCYQKIAREIGVTRMNDHLKKLDYGNMVVDASNIDLFWLQGDSRISQMEQIDFLERFYIFEIPISKRTIGIMKGLMVMEETNSYKISGKTGWSIRDGNNNGWFVGYLESSDDTHFFAVNIVPEQAFDMDLFPMIRKEVAYKAFRHLGVME